VDEDVVRAALPRAPAARTAIRTVSVTAVPAVAPGTRGRKPDPAVAATVKAVAVAAVAGVDRGAANAATAPPPAGSCWPRNPCTVTS
jgi:hypothetical protein